MRSQYPLPNLKALFFGGERFERLAFFVSFLCSFVAIPLFTILKNLVIARHRNQPRHGDQGFAR